MILSLEILGATQNELKALADRLPKAGALSFRPSKDGLFFWKWKGFQIDGIQDGLEATGPKSEYWVLNPETAKSFAELLREFFRICPRRFSLYAAVSGDLPKRETEVQFDELLELVGERKIASRVKYQVRLPAARSHHLDEETPEETSARQPT